MNILMERESNADGTNLPRILSYGEIGLDIYLAIDRLPTLELAANVSDEFENAGGAAANAAIWLAHWGLPSRLVGHDLGRDRAGDTMRQLLSEHPRLDTRYIRSRQGVPTPRCQCLVTPDGERFFIAHWPEDLPMTPATPEMLEGVAWLNLDMSGPKDARLQASHLGQAQNVPVLANDIYAVDDPILPQLDVLVMSAAVARVNRPDVTPLQLAKALQERGDCDLIVTDGAAPVAILPRAGDNARIQPAQIDPVDTTGAGDIFKAGLLYGLAHGMPLEEAARWGCAAATAMSTLPGTTRHLLPLSDIEAHLPGRA